MLTLCLMSLAASAQDPLFSQYYAMPLQINPAFAGTASSPRIGAAYRHQWPGFSTAYRTYAVFYEQGIDRLNSGVGINLEGDNAGDGIWRTTRLSALYSYRLNINDHLAVKIGVEAGAYQTALDWQRLVFPDQLDQIDGIVNNTGELRPDATTQTRLDLGAGLLLVSDKFYVGGGLKHLNTPEESFLLVNNNVTDGLPMRLTLQAGTEIVVKKGNKRRDATFISPNLLFASQGPYKQLNIGAYASAGPVFGGLWFRHTFQNSDAAIVSAGWREGIFKIGLSYDITVSGLASRAGGAYELTFGLLFDQNDSAKRKKRSDQINDCLRMFQ
jgi:type IX secretion system PorP/SprF family membrane protein